MIKSLIYLTTFFVPIFSLDKFDPRECGYSKSCIRWSSCALSKCDFGFTWKNITFNSKDYLEIEIVGILPKNSRGYLAIGFGKENTMFEDGVVTCRMQDGVLAISCGVNGNHYNTLFNSSQFDLDFLVTNEGTIYGIEFDAQNNILRCRFLRLMTPTLNKNDLKDLSSGNKYYLLSSKGDMNGAKKLSYHGVNKRISPGLYDLSSSSRVNNIITVNYLLVKLHGCLMIMGWILFATNGIFIAYFYKKNWSKNSILGEKLWFQFHRLLQTSCVLCVISGFVIIFVHVDGYSTLGSLTFSAHPILGITATTLMLANPIIALFRCKPDNKSRWIFNCLHLVVGVSAYILAISAMSIGIQLPPAGPDLPNMSSPWILVVTYLVLIILLFCYGNLKYRRNNQISLLNMDENDLVPTIQTTGYDVLFASITLSTIFFTILIILVIIF